MNIALTGGGTDGHIIPNLSLLPELRKHFENIYYFGTFNSRECKLAKENNLEFFAYPVVKFNRDKPLSFLSIPFKLTVAIEKAKKMLKSLRVNVVFAKGGFVSLPCAIAAYKLKIPVVCHESDLSLGLANKIIDKFSKYTITSFEKTHAKHKIYIGNPIREEYLIANKNNAIHELKLEKHSNKKILLIIGGSSGSKIINDVILESLDELLSKYIVVHILGSKYIPMKREDYYPTHYIKNIFDYYALADLVISRCGANCATELLTMKKRTLFIPLQNKASRGDQVLNAEYFSSLNSCMVLLQSNLNKRNLIIALDNLEKLNLTFPNFSIDINKKITKLLVSII